MPDPDCMRRSRSRTRRPGPGGEVLEAGRPADRDLRHCDQATSTPTVEAWRAGVRVEVGGLTAGIVDFNNLMRDRSGWVFAFVLSLARVCSATGVVPPDRDPDDGRGTQFAVGCCRVRHRRRAFPVGLGPVSSRIHQRARGHELASAVPVLVLFGLSMDYHVFILSRIREGYDRKHSTDQAVAHGIKATAGVFTAPTVVMVFVFLTFATLSMVSLKEMGVGPAVAVLLDATLVRAVLLPATMKLLGPRNWYLPRWLGWLPQISVVTPPHSAPGQPQQPVTAAGRSQAEGSR
jgi:putative drug exporter of the RND superfamily